MDPKTATFDIESEVAELLSELSDVQEKLLSVLHQKREMMANCDLEGMKRLQPQEESVHQRLEVCHQSRGDLLQRAAQQGFEAESLRQLAVKLPDSQNRHLLAQINEVSGRLRLVQHQSLTNWVLAQRSLLHVSQLLEIIATGGRLQPTYGEGEPVLSRGSLVDQAG